MADIDEIELRRLDLTVLLVFLNMMRLRKASDVADRMGLTQPAISHSIKRLRGTFGDPLFLRNPHGMAPTAFATALEPKIRSVVDTLSQALKAPATFDPANATDTVRIGAYDYETATLVPNLLRRIKAEAPMMRVSVLPVGRKQALQALEDNEIDLALGFVWDLPKSFASTTLYHEDYRVVHRKDRWQDRKRLGLDAYCAADHLIVSPIGDFDGIVDQELAKIGRERRVSTTVPLFLPALAVVAASDLIATLPRRLVTSHAARFGLVHAEPPIELRPFPVSAITHKRNVGGPLHEWLLAQVKAAAGTEQPAIADPV